MFVLTLEVVVVPSGNDDSNCFKREQTPLLSFLFIAIKLIKQNVLCKIFRGCIQNDIKVIIPCQNKQSINMIILLLDNLCYLLDILCDFLIFVHTQDPVEPYITNFSCSSKPACQRSSSSCTQNSKIADDHMPTLLLPAFGDLSSNPVCVIQ